MLSSLSIFSFTQKKKKEHSASIIHFSFFCFFLQSYSFTGAVDEIYLITNQELVTLYITMSEVLRIKASL